MTLFGTVTNLSDRGLFLQTLPIIETGSEIDIRLVMQDVGDLHARGKIMWKCMYADANPEEAKNGHNNRLPGLGIAFSHIFRGKELIGQYISRRSIIPSPARR